MNERKSAYPIDPLILNRWSPRSMTGEELTNDELMTLFEAARWAPSSYNGQPWRFIYAQKGSLHFERLFDLLVEANQAWCKNAAVLIVVVSHKVFERNNKPSPTHTIRYGSRMAELRSSGIEGQPRCAWPARVRL